MNRAFYLKKNIDLKVKMTIIDIIEDQLTEKKHYSEIDCFEAVISAF